MSRDPRIPCAPAGLPAGAPQDAPLDKAALRKALASRRAALDPAVKAEWDGRICHKLVEWWHTVQVPSVAVYWPIRGEPDLAVACDALAGLGVQLALPVVLQKAAPLSFAEWRFGEDMVKDAMGMVIPAQLRLMEKPAGIVIPCLGFNAAGFRLGYGGGYYDRTLETQPRPRTVGVAYEFGRVEFASAPYDVALDLVLTEA
ncbi:5-formyltetrahydrofolate cyclo-ligase [Massilia arenosa]|uniref:5-formyltetrahydrofolate cyclo-ligase n=1 Tax=Zemynaea arenosa TaxID=2561931 RepID=A0A4Y9S4B7_9BURK|nr:5-formyltetrahydrofolate cyclo-ligase [Massilia arenosa]